MAYGTLRPLDSIQRRDLLARRDADPELLRAYARFYLEHNEFDNALDFFDRIGDAEGLAAVKQHALDEGDAYLLLRLADCAAAGVTESDFRAVGQRALSLSKYAYAAQAFRKAGMADELEKVLARLPASVAASPFMEKLEKEQ